MDAFSSSRLVKRVVRIMRHTPVEIDMLLELLDSGFDVNPRQDKNCFLPIR
jgi:hypothetical protein